MNLVYFDEQAASHQGRTFTAIHGLILRAATLHEARSRYFCSIEDVLGLEKFRGGERNIWKIPVLHGSKLLEEYPDDVKISAMDLLMSCFADTGARFFRLGYYDDSLRIFRNRKSREQLIDFCLNSLLLALKETFSEPFVLVHELDREGFKRHFRFVSDRLDYLYLTGLEVDPQYISIDYRNMVGHYVASKQDLACQAADLVGYMAMKKETAATTFAHSIAEVYDRYSSCFLINEIIAMREVTRD